MTWTGYTVTGCDARGQVQAEALRVMGRHQAVQLAVGMRAEGMRVSVWPALPKDVQLDGVKLLKTLLTEP